MEPNVEVEDPEAIEEITDVLIAKGFFHGTERPAVKRWFLAWELEKKNNYETEVETSPETSTRDPDISANSGTSP